MKRPAVFFDRDNTLISNDGYLGDPSKVVLVDGAAEAVERVRALGFAAVTISNQSGVARGMFTEEAVHAVNARMDELLQDQSARAIIDRHEFCPYHPDAVVERYRQESDLRKPKPGMILQAAERLGLDLSRSWVIGDAPRDIEAGKAADCRTILFINPARSCSPAAVSSSGDLGAGLTPDFVVTSLKEAVEIIGRNTMNKAQIDPSATGDEMTADSQSGVVAEKSVALEASGHAGPSSRRPTFGERVRAGTFLPARIPEQGGAAIPRSRSTLPVSAGRVAAVPESGAPEPSAPAPSAETAPQTRPTEPSSETELLEPILQQILEEVRLLRQRQPYSDFAVTKLLAGIVQVLVLPALFFAYLHRDTPQDLQSSLILSVVLQTMTIALLIMGRQS